MTQRQVAASTWVVCMIHLVVLLPVHSHAGTLQDLLSAYPGLNTYYEGELLSRIYGVPFGTGADPQTTADNFVIAYAGIWNLNPEELLPQGPMGWFLHDQGMMWDAASGTYKFRLLTYQQGYNGVGINGATLRLLIRNVPPYELWLAASSLRPSSGSGVPQGSPGVDIAEIVANFQDPNFTIVDKLNRPGFSGECFS